MKKQIFTIILLLMGGVSAFGQFTLDGGTNPIRLRTDGIIRMYIAPNSATAPVLPGNVGIGTSTPDAKLDVFGDFILSKRTVIQTTGVQNAFDRQGASFLFFDSMGTITLNGITNGIVGMVVYLAAGINNTLIINNENAASLPNDRIYTNTGASLTITGRGGATLIYGSGGWRVIGFAD